MPRSKKQLLAITLPATAILIIIGVMTGDAGVAVNMGVISMFVNIVPLFLLRYAHFLWLRSLEDRFPDFVRDLADTRRSGMAFKESITLLSKANYGKLSGEIQRMHNRLTWGVPFLRALDLFQSAVRESRVIREALTIIRESYLSGGDVAATLESVARDMVVLKETELERQSMVRQQVLIMYGIFFMFLGIAVMIVFVMVPLLRSSPSLTPGGSPASSGVGGLTFTNPCDGVTIFPCSAFSLVGVILGIPEGVALYYTALFFYVVLIVGLFTGLIAGQLGSNSVLAGGKHSIIMLAAAFAIFMFIAKAGLIPT